MNQNVKLKKAFSFVLTLAVSLSCITGCSNSQNSTGADSTLSSEQNAFISSIGGVSETFEGGVSQQSYSTAELAAQAYVSEEVVGEKNAEICSATSTGTLSKKEVQALSLPADIRDEADSVETYDITYRTYGDATSNDKTTYEESTIKVYIIKLGTDWKYYTPRPVNGQTIQKSYYDSVFDTKKYENCTFVNTMSIAVNVSGNMDGETVNETTSVDIDQTIKYDNGRIYIEQKYAVVSGGTTITQTVYAYLETLDDNITCYFRQSTDEDWVISDLTAIGFNTLEDLQPFHDQYLDYTYFTKTDYGFELGKENAASYFQQALSDAIGQMGVSLDLSNTDIDMFAEYYVSQGALSGLRMSCDVAMNMDILGVNASISESIQAQTTCTNYGTTVVERPFSE